MEKIFSFMQKHTSSLYKKNLNFMESYSLWSQSGNTFFSSSNKYPLLEEMLDIFGLLTCWREKK